MDSHTDLRVLVAEDEPDTLRGLERMLGRRGYQVRGASDGLEAAKELSARPFDVVVSDLKMPRLDGMDLLRMTRNTNRETVFIMITAYGTIPGATEAMKLGSFDYLTKPFAAEDLIEAIDRGCRQKRATTARRQARDPGAREPLPSQEWQRTVWQRSRELDLDAALISVVELANDAFGARIGFEKQYGERRFCIETVGDSSSCHPTEPRIPLYREIYLVVESWGTLTRSEQTRLVQFLRRMVLGKLVILR